MAKRTYRYVCILTISLIGFLHPAHAQHTLAGKAEEAPLFGGVAVGVDLVGPVMKLTHSRFSQIEVAARVNFKEKYYPVFEMGLGDCTKEGEENNNTFSVTAPYFRIGADYNLNKKVNGNRLFLGLRYAFSSYRYDYEAPDFQDPVWGTTTPLSVTGQKGGAQWVEVVAGVETKLWSIIRLGWSIRFKGRIHQNASQCGEPWYIPGYGRNGGSTFGGTMNLIFDIGKSARKQPADLTPIK